MTRGQTFALFEDTNLEAHERPVRNKLTGKLERFSWPRIRLAGPYVVIASRLIQTSSGATHMGLCKEVDGVVDMDAMTMCGRNARTTPTTTKWVLGPVRLTCKRCTTIVFGWLCRLGKLEGWTR